MRVILIVLSWVLFVEASKKPNFVIVLTDDQDIVLGSVTPLKQVQKLVANQGATFTNAFVSTPICCPSRSSFLTGLYQHNHHTLNNSLSGGCSGPAWQRDLEPRTFAATLHRAGYRTFYAGKYLNAYGYPKAGGTQHVPAGWDWWVGLVGNSRYYNYTLSINGTARHFTDQYLTTVIQNYSVDFLESMRHASSSFLMILSTPAAHTPYTPEPKYRGRYRGIKVPRTPNFNTHKLRDRHWLLNMEPLPLPQETVDRLDSYHARRWETLLSVDDMVAATVRKLEDIGQLDNTFIIYTSDHGYHLGQFGLPWDKRQPYETDIRVPLFVRGPGVSARSVISELVVNIDIAPTVLDIAALPVDDTMDGRSFLRRPTNSSERGSAQEPPREDFFLEYVGEGDRTRVSSECSLLNDDTLTECYPDSSCKCQDSRNNTYICLRRLDTYENFLYCEFYKEIGLHREFYDIKQDPYQLENLYPYLNSTKRRTLHKSVKSFM